MLLSTDLPGLAIERILDIIVDSFSPKSDPNSSARSILVGRLGAFTEALVSGYEKDARLSCGLDDALVKIALSAFSTVKSMETESNTRSDYLKALLRIIKMRTKLFRENDQLSTVCDFCKRLKQYLHEAHCSFSNGHIKGLW